MRWREDFAHLGNSQTRMAEIEFVYLFSIAGLWGHNLALEFSKNMGSEFGRKI